MTLISENKDNKIMMFIDLRNVENSVKTVEGQVFMLDYKALAMTLAGTRELVAAYVFDSMKIVESEDKRKRFHDKLRHIGFRVMARDAYDSVRNEQKEVDVAMACEMVVHALRDHYDVAVVVSGDRDFIPAIQHVQAAGKRVEVAAFEKSVAKEVIRSADKFYELEKLPLLSMSNPADKEEMPEEEIEPGKEEENGPEEGA